MLLLPIDNQCVYVNHVITRLNILLFKDISTTTIQQIQRQRKRCNVRKEGERDTTFNAFIFKSKNMRSERLVIILIITY